MNLKELFEKYDDGEFLKFDRVQNKLSNRRDLHAFLLLDKLVPGDRSIVSGAQHDEIWLDVGSEELEAVATEDQIIDLVRCGVRLDNQTESLAMFA